MIVPTASSASAIEATPLPVTETPATEAPVTNEPVVAAVALQTVPAVETRQEREARKRREYEERRARVVAERRKRAEEQRLARETKTGVRATFYGSVEISCTQVIYHYRNFPATGVHTVDEIVSVDGAREYNVLYSFEGTTGSNTVQLYKGELNGLHRIDARMKWQQAGAGRVWINGWDIASHRTCLASPRDAFVIQKRQHIEGTPGSFVETPLHGEVGQRVLYEIVVTNTGGVELEFSGFSDPHCEPGTLKGNTGSLRLVPSGATRFFCSHVLTAADLAAGSYTNAATITGTPEGGSPVTHESNTVITILETPTAKKEREEKEKVEKEKAEKERAEKEKSGNGGSNQGGSTGVLASTEASGGNAGNRGTAAAVPVLTGAPEGCARSSFVISVRAKGVKSVTFYLDGHRLKTLSAHAAKHGKISIRINIARLRLGPHHITARITMTPLTASAKARVASRTLTFVRCASATVSPHFTG